MMRNSSGRAHSAARPRQRHGWLLAAVLTAIPAVASHAQSQAETDYPNRLIKIIVPYTPGGLVDTFTRTLAQHLGDKFGRAVVVENRSGANQAIGAEAAARATPDGYTLFVSSQTGMILNPLTRKDLPFDPVRDFTPVATMFSTPFYLVVNSSVKAKSVEELVKLAKAQPGKLTYASLGRGGTHHLAGELFKLRTGADILHVPYKGSAPAINDLLGGQVDMMFEGGTSSLPYVESGRLRALASTGEKRTEAMPNLPALNEIVPGFSMTVWIGLLAPSGVPRPIVDKINREVNVMLRSPLTHEKFAKLAIETMPGTPEQFASLIQSDIPAWTKVLKEAGVEPE